MSARVRRTRLPVAASAATRAWSSAVGTSGNPPARKYPIYTKDSALNFPQAENYEDRLSKRYPKELERLDVIMYRITDERETNFVLATMQRGIPVRLISEWNS